MIGDTPLRAFLASASVFVETLPFDVDQVQRLVLSIASSAPAGAQAFIRQADAAVAEAYVHRDPRHEAEARFTISRMLKGIEIILADEVSD